MEEVPRLASRAPFNSQVCGFIKMASYQASQLSVLPAAPTDGCQSMKSRGAQGDGGLLTHGGAFFLVAELTLGS